MLLSHKYNNNDIKQMAKVVVRASKANDIRVRLLIDHVAERTRLSCAEVGEKIRLLSDPGVSV